MSQVRRDSYHLGGDYATNEMEAREKIRETIVRLLTRIKSEVTTNVMAPLAITDPMLFAQLSAKQWMDEFRESRRDHGHFRDWLLDGLKQLVDAVDEARRGRQEGDYRMDVEKLQHRLTKAQLMLGPVGETVPSFLKRSPAPVAFVAIDHARHAPRLQRARLIYPDASG